MQVEISAYLSWRALVIGIERTKQREITKVRREKRLREEQNREIKSSFFDLIALQSFRKRERDTQRIP